MNSLSYRLDKNIHFIEELFNAKEKVFIYGAGKEALSLIRRLRIANLHPDGIIVSKKQNDYVELNGIPLYEASSVSLDVRNDAIIIAVRNRKAVEEILDNINVQWRGHNGLLRVYAIRKTQQHHQLSKERENCKRQIFFPVH